MCGSAPVTMVTSSTIISWAVAMTSSATPRWRLFFRVPTSPVAEVSLPWHRCCRPQPAELLQALHVVMGGDALLSPAITRRLIGEFVARPPDAVAAAGMEALTNREREAVALVAHGLSNDELAGAMVLSPATAKTHVSRAMIKLGARDRAQLVVFAYQTGLATPRAAGHAAEH
jgi:DNA-binding CsgD family transcriptional regulator